MKRAEGGVFCFFPRTQNSRAEYCDPHIFPRSLVWLRWMFRICMFYTKALIPGGHTVRDWGFTVLAFASQGKGWKGHIYVS